MHMNSVSGKVAFITGGDSGLGLGIARAFLRAGMKVVITYRDENHLKHATRQLSAAGGTLHSIKLDVADRSAYRAAADDTIRVFGKVHVLVNNAGVWPTVPLSNASFHDFDWCMSVNVTGVFNGIRTLLSHIRSHGEGGHIVTTSSITGLACGALWGLYSTSKFAVVGMMEALRVELEDSEVGVSVFCPGGIISNIGRSDRNRPAELSDTGVPDAVQAARLQTYGKKVREIMLKSGGKPPMLDPMEAGELVLKGVLHNDLYIISHSEYESAIGERAEALLASLPENREVGAERAQIARVASTTMYAREAARRKRSE